MTDLVQLYNPANAASLTPEQLQGLQHLTSEQIKELAIAYPNEANNMAYLLIIDNRIPLDKQLPGLNTFQNLWNLREKNAQKFMVAYQFMANYKPEVHQRPISTRRVEVLDLSDTELMTLPGFKVAGEVFQEEKVKVIKVKKEKIS